MGYRDYYFTIYTTMLGIILMDTWKLFKNRHCKGFRKVSISEFADILANEFLDEANEVALLPLTNISITEGVKIESEISQLSTQVSTTKELMHTMEFLNGGKQVRCIWCSCINLIKRKTTLKYLECNKGFCRNHR